MNKLKLMLLPLVLLTGCSNGNYSDIQRWMKEQTIGQRGHIEPLSQAKEFTPVPFIAKADPFQDKPLISLSLNENKYAPNPDRRKEPLEAYPLESLKMTGILIRDKIIYGLILAPDGTINYITKNNYIGQNYGHVLEINDSQIILDERIKNSSDEWEPKKTIVNLDDGDNKTSN
jgi:type IV pilus assembly protein PilP